MQNEKPFHNLDEQIAKLRGRGLLITDEYRTKRQLLKTSYYDLINGYKDFFLLEQRDACSDEIYKEGSKIEDLIKLFELDRELRHIVMRVTLDVESNFYTTLAYCLSEKYGEKESEYLVETNFRKGTRQARGGYERDNLFRKVNRRIECANEHPMKYYKERYNNVPPWILAKHMSFGELIVMYKLSKAEIKDKVIEHFTGKEPTEELKEIFLKSMELFNKFRNRAAHGGRIYNYRTNIEIPFNEDLHGILYITKGEHNEGIGRSDFSALVLARMHLKQHDKGEYVEKAVHLNHALEGYKKESPEYYNQVLKEMGLPVNYNERIMATLRY